MVLYIRTYPIRAAAQPSLKYWQCGALMSPQCAEKKYPYYLLPLLHNSDEIDFNSLSEAPLWTFCVGLLRRILNNSL